MNCNKQQELKIGKYKHFKGNMYEVLGVAKHSETLEDFVIYKALYKNAVSEVWIRPINMFLEKIERDGKIVNRFEYIGK